MHYNNNWLILTTLCLPGLTHAQEPEPRYEITPFAGYRVGGEFDDRDDFISLEAGESNAWGITVNGRADQNTQWEVLYARQSTDVDTLAVVPGSPALDLDIDYLHIGGTYLFDSQPGQPYIVATLGATRFDPEPSRYDAKTYFSGSLGAGWKIALGRRLGLRFEARGFATFLDTDTSLFCESTEAGGSCLIIGSGDVFAQWEARAGLSFRF